MRNIPDGGRLLGLDVGGKRIGIAVSDEGQILASPWGMVEQGRNAIEQIGRIARETGAVAIVAGLPTGLSGREGSQAAETRRFADSVGATLDLPLSYWDERLTSSQAERMLIDAGMRRKDRRGQIDALAASLMLQNYLDSRRYRRRRNEGGRQNAAS
ncbi:MAG TPA: Holliday junction resolvase RuvX [Thermomicrobiales bacterium]|nr:Holliday junction resolvase RuvX [Thermomicrobiales bacterium]